MRQLLRDYADGKIQKNDEGSWVRLCGSCEDPNCGNAKELTYDEVKFLKDQGRITAAQADPNKNREGKVKDIEVVREGTQVILPPRMSFDEAIDWLKKKQAEDERVINIRELVKCHPADGAHALVRALAKKYGWINLVPTPGFFGPTPPTMFGVNVGVDKVVQVPWGQIQIPGVAGKLSTAYEFVDGEPQFLILANTKQKHAEEIAEIARLTREYIRTDSIYRGKAIRIKGELPDPEDFNPVQEQPKFIDLSRVDENELVLPSDVEAAVVTSLFTPIEHTLACKEAGIPLKRGILLEGPYGTGKTLTAYVAAKKCEESGWTFIYLDSVKSLAAAINFARQYQPAVVFCEDIDRVLNTDERDDEMDNILNTIDGIESKQSDIMVVLTTNHVENITQAMMRPGRLDAIITVRPPDSKAAERLLRIYARGMLKEGEDLTEVAKLLDGHIPAVIREVIERSKLVAIGRLGRGARLDLTGQDLLIAAQGMQGHLNLLGRGHKTKESEMMVISSAFTNALHTVLKNGKTSTQEDSD
jgi:transitional endoplasmic reticulum ATPase